MPATPATPDAPTDAPARLSRRRVTAGAAWAAPVVMVVAASPAFAASPCVTRPSAPKSDLTTGWTLRNNAAVPSTSTFNGDVFAANADAAQGSVIGVSVLSSQITGATSPTTSVYELKDRGSTITFTSTFQTGWGNTCAVCSKGAGMIIQYRTASLAKGALAYTSWTAWTTAGEYVTRTGMSSSGQTISVPNDAGGTDSITTSSAPTLVSPDAGGTCGSQAKSDFQTYSFSISTGLAESTFVEIRYIFYLDPRPTANCSNVKPARAWASDDFYVRVPTTASATAITCAPSG